MKYYCISNIFFLILITGTRPVTGQETVLYKQVDTAKLFLEVYAPKANDKLRPAMVFFFGGGWRGGTRQQFLPHARYFSQKGIVCFLADYRTEKGHGVTPFQCVEDAKSAIRFIRSNAERFQVDTSRLIAAGGSAGGHLAAATACINKYSDPMDPPTGCIPNALVLFNPVLDNGPGGYGYERIGEAYPDFSPLHNVREGMPPTILFLGTNDRLIPVETLQYFQTIMQRVGSRCELELYRKEGHGFFNYKHRKRYTQTVKQAEDFLKSLRYIDAEL